MKKKKMFSISSSSSSLLLIVSSAVVSVCSLLSFFSPFYVCVIISGVLRAICTTV